MLLDHWLSDFVRGKLQPVVRDILRLAAYQLCFLDRIPPSAAVNEAVEQTRRLANQQAARLVNGVLRNLLRAMPLALPDDLSLRYSHPEPIVRLFLAQFGREETERLLADKSYLESVYRAGAEKAAYVANRTLSKVYKKVGFLAR